MNNLMRRHFMGGKKEADPTESFIITVSVGAGETFTLALIPSGTYNFQVLDWGDEISDTITSYNQAEVTHTYTDAGTYDIEMNGVIEGWQMSSTPSSNRNRLIQVKQWGSLIINDLGAFEESRELVSITAPDIPNLSSNNALEKMFDNCRKLQTISNLGNWDISGQNNMTRMFTACFEFNEPSISNLDVSSVTNFRDCFRNAYIFNQNIGGWQMSSATNLREMFYRSTGGGKNAFNNGGSSDINNWDVSNVTDMFGTFNNSDFNQNIGDWNFSNVTNISNMFANNTAFNNGGSSDINNWITSSLNTLSGIFNNATSFNQPLDNWDVSGVTNFSSIFWNATSFNQSLNSWDVSNGTNFTRAFENADAFQQPLNNWVMSSATILFRMFAESNVSGNNLMISGWNVSNCSNFRAMFFRTSFNEDISGWDVSSGVDFGFMFSQTPFNQNISGWDISSATILESMFRFNLDFDQNISSWNIASLTNADEMFFGATLSTANYDALLIGWESQAVQNNVNFDGGNSQYTAGSAAATARQNLITDHSWSITDGGAI